jgi:hypothetical protein
MIDRLSAQEAMTDRLSAQAYKIIIQGKLSISKKKSTKTLDISNKNQNSY